MRVLELFSQDSGCSRDHEVARKHAGAGAEDFVSCLLASPRVSPVDDIVLQERGVVRDLNGGSQCHDLVILDGILEI